MGSRLPPGWWEALEVSKPAGPVPAFPCHSCFCVVAVLQMSTEYNGETRRVALGLVLRSERHPDWFWLRVLQFREAEEDLFPDSTLPLVYALSPSHLF